MEMRFLKEWMVLMAAGVMFAGCQKGGLYNPGQDNDQPKGEYFDFSTSREIKMNIQYDVPEGYRVIFDIYDQLPMVEKDGRIVLNTELQPIASGITNGYGKYELEKVLPAAVKDVYVYTADLFAASLLRGQVEGNVVTAMETVDLSELRTPVAETALSTRASDAWLTLGKWDTDGMPYYGDETKRIEVASSTLTSINKSFPDREKVSSVYFKKTDLYVAEDAEIWLTVISSKGEYNNSLGYYCYTGKPEDVNPGDVKKIVALPCAKSNLFEKSTGNRKRKSFEAVQLKYYNPETGRLEATFPKGTSIGWVLLSDGFTPGRYFTPGKIDYKKESFYSYAPWNPEKTNKEHMILFKTKDNGTDFVAFGFEDMNNNGGDQDCNDVMFHVLANPIDAITDEIPEVPETPDEDIVKDEIYRGTLVFEDLWPRQGDYDLNDVVVKYKSTATSVVESNKDYDSYGEVTKVKDEFSLIWAGALYHNGLGYQMEVDNSNIKSLKVTREGEEIASAWDKNLGKVTIMLAEDVLEEIGESTGTVMNYTVEIEFANPVPVQEFNKEKSHAPYNPFIVSKENTDATRVEIHLPMYAPTMKSCTDLFGTADDRSDVNVGRFYVSEEMFPFALHIFGDNDFINKEEGVRIDITYPKYRNWVEKNGKEDADWYKYPVGK